MVSPTTDSVAPWVVRCTGVMDMRPTITAWDRATTSTARRAAGTVRNRVNPPAGLGVEATDSPRDRATLSGSGRNPMKYTMAPSTWAHSAITNPR